MDTDIEKVKREYDELRKLLKEQAGKTVTQKFMRECYQRIGSIQSLMFRVDPKVIEKLERLRASEEGEWHFVLKNGDKGIEITAEAGWSVVVPEASNRLHVRQERR